MDRKKKIAEIKARLDVDFYVFSERDMNGEIIEYDEAQKDISFLLSELERLEREYAEERAAHNAHVTELCELEQERDKLVECLRFYERMARGREANDGGRRARTIFAEIGVTVE